MGGSVSLERRRGAAAAGVPDRMAAMSRRNVFSGPYLDRMGHLRSDPGWFESALNDTATRVVPIWSSRALIAGGDEPSALFLQIRDIEPSQRNAERLILLGRRGDHYYFAFDVDEKPAPATPPESSFQDLRWIASRLAGEDAGILAYAIAMTWWRRSHRHCGICGTHTQSAKGGHTLICTNPDCRHEQFPRLDPAIIVLVSDGDRALLGRQASWPAGRYSTIAGFVEPGESLEDAVAREVREETGIEIDSIAYQSSQPWPFPASLMLGFSAQARSTEIQLNDRELEDARWFSRADITAGQTLLPPNPSISFRLIEDWFDAGGGRLRDLHGHVPWPQNR
jgi:NAD+ diphosphatase